MGYRIDYDRKGGKYEVKQTHPLRFPALLMAAFALFVVLTLQFWEEGTAVLREISIPGDNAVTVQAFQMLTDDLRCGASMQEAVEAFCAEVIYGAMASD